MNMNDQNTINSLYENLPDNSNKAKAEAKQLQQMQGQPATEKRVEKVVKGRVKTKKNEMRRLSDIFISEDVSNIKDYILLDVLAPAIKDAIYKIIVGSLDTTLYGGRGYGGKRPTADKISYKDYNGISSRRDDRGNDRPRTASGYSYDDVIFETRGAAEAVLDRMYELIEEYGNVRVADMYDMAGITGNYTDNRYGWENLHGARVERTRDGYAVRMPRAKVLK